MRNDITIRVALNLDELETIADALFKAKAEAVNDNDEDSYRKIIEVRNLIYEARDMLKSVLHVEKERK